MLLMLPLRAWADERSSTLLLSVAAPAAETTRLETVARELLTPLDVQLELRRVPRIDLAELRRASAEPYFARVWIAFSETGSARLYLEHGASDRLLVRDVPGDANNPELLREELGHILQTAVEGLKAGEEVGEPRQEVLKQVAPEEPPVVESAPPKPPASAPNRRSLWQAGARYEARRLGDGARFEDGPGAVITLTSPLGFELAGYYRRPLTIDASPVGARLQTVALRALLTLQAWKLRFGAGLGADFVRVNAVGGAADTEITGPSWRKLALGRLQATYGFRVAAPVELQISAGTDLDVSDTRYVFSRSAGEVTVLEPSPIRPFLSVGALLP